MYICRYMYRDCVRRRDVYKSRFERSGYSALSPPCFNNNYMSHIL